MIGNANGGHSAELVLTGGASVCQSPARCGPTQPGTASNSWLAAARERVAGGCAKGALAGGARAAGGGLATQYRHFPTRDALVCAVYRSELDVLAAEAGHLLDAHRALDALRSWTDRYTRFVATKRAMHDAVRAAQTSRTSAVPDTRARIAAIIARFLAAGASDGTIRDDVAPDDVAVWLASTVVLTASTDKGQMRRLLDLLMDALRSRR